MSFIPRRVEVFQCRCIGLLHLVLARHGCCHVSARNGDRVNILFQSVERSIPLQIFLTVDFVGVLFPLFFLFLVVLPQFIRRISNRRRNAKPSPRQGKDGRCRPAHHSGRCPHRRNRFSSCPHGRYPRRRICRRDGFHRACMNTGSRRTCMMRRPTLRPCRGCRLPRNRRCFRKTCLCRRCTYRRRRPRFFRCNHAFVGKYRARRPLLCRSSFCAFRCNHSFICSDDVRRALCYSLIISNDLCCGSRGFRAHRLDCGNLYFGTLRRLEIYLFIHLCHIALLLCCPLRCGLFNAHGRCCRKTYLFRL